MGHDQSIKNLILDYPRQALAFFAAEEACTIAADARVIPIRQEQLQERLGEHFRDLDIPLLVEWPDGRRAALLFVLEEETEPRRFSIHRPGEHRSIFEPAARQDQPKSCPCAQAQLGRGLPQALLCGAWPGVLWAAVPYRRPVAPIT
jgi:hypothetical protein